MIAPSLPPCKKNPHGKQKVRICFRQIFTEKIRTLLLSESFLSYPRNIPKLRLSASTVDIDNKSWQEDVDSILNIDTSCDTRKDSVSELLKKSDVIIEDVKAAIRDKDIKKIAPPKLAYGKAVEGLQAFRRQLFSDLIPDILFNEGPKLLQDAPKIINELVADGPKTMSGLFSKGQDLVSTVRDLTQDPSLLQSTVDDVRREVKNVLRNTPEGLQTPDYTVVKSSEAYELRKYSTYSVCSTELPTDGEQSTMSPITTGKGFNKLAGYIFGDNNVDNIPEKMAMTTPVIISSGTMEFVLPSGMSTINAPLPATSDITIKDIPSEIVAVREFPGIATDGEVMRQRASLEDALLADGMSYDNLSFRVLQYNPPYTLPWLRRNEVILRILDNIAVTEAPLEEFESKDSSEFFSSPEAGD
eukprot:gene8662-17874_t